MPQTATAPGAMAGPVEAMDVTGGFRVLRD
ncbi:hypothetical protein CLV72_101761 [Allonocardiopsis opalescens]|uniref:Uncharacterized protein n=1 Tax=Allonocardiopsis opalescens TaxID=1144618 RepID=A0A2T0QE58_9ACTN|nr:hypothetical protein CLV72_101761 [Allonocardiopsis opalescens]